MIIPPSEWNPKIRIEPPEKYLSKVTFFLLSFLRCSYFSGIPDDHSGGGGGSGNGGSFKL